LPVRFPATIDRPKQAGKDACAPRMFALLLIELFVPSSVPKLEAELNCRGI
jgi:hypothetical protein